MSAGIITFTLTVVDAGSRKAVNGVRNLLLAPLGVPPTRAEKRSYALPLSLGIASLVGGIFF